MKSNKSKLRVYACRMCGKEGLPYKKETHWNQLDSCSHIANRRNTNGWEMENDDCRAFIRAEIIKMISMSFSGKSSTMNGGEIDGLPAVGLGRAESEIFSIHLMRRKTMTFHGMLATGKRRNVLTVTKLQNYHSHMMSWVYAFSKMVQLFNATPNCSSWDWDWSRWKYTIASAWSKTCPSFCVTMPPPLTMPPPSSQWSTAPPQLSQWLSPDQPGRVSPLLAESLLFVALSSRGELT